jgi:hypothetical protein
VAGVDGERGQNRKDLGLEVLVDGLPLRTRQLVDAQQAHAVLGESR